MKSSDWEVGDGPLPVLCWCEAHTVRVERRFIQSSLTEPCNNLKCLQMALAAAEKDALGIEVLLQAHVYRRLDIRSQAQVQRLRGR